MFPRFKAFCCILFAQTFNKNIWKILLEELIFYQFQVLSSQLYQKWTSPFFNLCFQWGSHWRYSVKEGVLKNFAKFTGNHLCQSLLFRQACNFIKKDSGTGVFLWILRNFLEHLFLQNTSSGCLIENRDWKMERIRYRPPFGDCFWMIVKWFSFNDKLVVSKN